MADTVLYNPALVEGFLSQVNALNAQGQDLSHQMDQQYQNLDNVASGDATQAGMEWAAQSMSIRNDAAEIVQLMHQAGASSLEDQIGVDQWARGIMGA